MPRTVSATAAGSCHLSTIRDDARNAFRVGWPPVMIAVAVG